MAETARARTPDDDVDDQMAAQFAAWLARRPPRKPEAPPPPKRVTRPVVDHRMISVRQAAREIGKSVRTIRRWMEEGLLDTRHDAKGCVRIRAGSLWRDETVLPEPEP